MKKDKKTSTTPARLPLEVLAADPERGLCTEQVTRRTEMGWANGTPTAAGKTEREIVLTHIFTFFNLIFMVLAVVLLLTGSSVKNMTFLIVAVCNTAIGIFQQIRAKRAVDALSLVAAHPVKVIRNGARIEVAQEHIVRDDIAEFATGDQIAADGIVRTGELRVDESLITGESDAIEKKAGDTVRSGSFVLTGRARVQLTAVGADSFATQLSLEAKQNPQASKSEMMRSLDRLIFFIGIALVPIGLLLFYQEHYVLALGLGESVEGTVAALVGMIPEGLYLLTSVAMAASARKLSKQRVLVQDMNCIESLARVDVLCVDKTGTITEPKMEVDNLIPLSSDPPEYVEKVLAALYSAAEPENDTARAMAEIYSAESDWICEKWVPFSSSAKWSGGVFREWGAFLAGAPEFILGTRYAEVADLVNEWTAQGYRVLLVAAYDGDPIPNALDEARIRPIALITLTSPLRPEARDTFAYFEAQGVSVRVISGDNPVTVSAVAARAGIRDAEKYVDASTLQSDEDFDRAVEAYTVFGRVTPDQKKKLIAAMQKQRHTVAMTGDGVNDLLAMKQSDCSIAMASGAQAASQVASLVLLDSDFSAMPSIVGEGRRVINNIQRAATLFLVKNIFSLALSVISLFTNWPYPLAPLHLSVISTLTIGIPSFFLAMEPNYERVSGKFLPSVLRRALPGGMTNIFVVLFAQAFRDVYDLPADPIATVCAGILAVVGLLVLFQTCKPFDRFRKIIWAAMAVLLVVCFTLFGTFLELRTGGAGTNLVMATLLLMTPTVFFALQRTFDFLDRLRKR